MNKPFENDKYIGINILKLKQEFNIETIVETGTYIGNSAKFFGKNFNKVYTIELFEENSKRAQENCKEYTNMDFLVGDSVGHLGKIIKKIKKQRTLFFLDSHLANHYTPTPKELELIKNMIIEPVICIHDFVVPGTNLKYDKYPDFEYKFKSIKKYLDKIYKNGYNYYYNNEIESSGAKVGVIYITPKNLNI